MVAGDKRESGNLDSCDGREFKMRKAQTEMPRDIQDRLEYDDFEDLNTSSG